MTANRRSFTLLGRQSDGHGRHVLWVVVHAGWDGTLD